jgi:hypothetical protein
MVRHGQGETRNERPEYVAASNRTSTCANREEVYTGRERWFDAGEASGICSSDSTEAKCFEGYDAAHEEQRS